MLKHRIIISAEEGSTDFNPTCKIFDEEQLLEDKIMEIIVGQFFQKLSSLLIGGGEYNESNGVDSTYQYNFRCFIHYIHSNNPKIWN